jgi:hypothetical protein
MLVVFDTSGQNMFELSLYFALLISRHISIFCENVFHLFWLMSHIGFTSNPTLFY